MNEKITSSIVLYNNDSVVLEKAIHAVLGTALQVKLYLIDNSPTDVLKNIVSDPRIEYMHNPANPGFGAAHNIALKKSIELGSKFHFIVNPDIYFTADVIASMVEYMASDHTIGMMMPEVLNEDGSIQYLPKLLPNPFSIIRRKFSRAMPGYAQFIERYELRSVPSKMIYNAPVLSGCFTLLNMEAVKRVGMYDDAFFMYFEDWDLSRRMHKAYKTLYYPRVSVVHEYESGANKSKKLFKIFVNSAVTYFNKWGWIFDKERNMFNKKALKQF